MYVSILKVIYFMRGNPNAWGSIYGFWYKDRGAYAFLGYPYRLFPRRDVFLFFFVGIDVIDVMV